MLKLSKLTRNTTALRSKQQARVLHFDPTSLERARKSITEPQVLGDFYKYRYSYYQAPETFGGLFYVHHEPYKLSIFYDWENYMPTEQGEWWSYTSMWIYAVFGFSYVWIFLKMAIREIDAEKHNVAPTSLMYLNDGIFWDGYIDSRLL